MQFTKNSIFIYGKIGVDKNDDSNASVSNEMLNSHSIMKSIIENIENGETEINIYINSLAAELEDVLELLAFIQLVEIPINIFCLGSVASYSSWLLFLANGRRYASKTALIKTCDFIDSSGYMGQSEFDSYCIARKAVRDTILGMISKKSRLSINEVETYLFSPRIKSLGVEELLKYGLIDEVL